MGLFPYELRLKRLFILVLAVTISGFIENSILKKQFLRLNRLWVCILAVIIFDFIRFWITNHHFLRLKLIIFSVLAVIKFPVLNFSLLPKMVRNPSLQSKLFLADLFFFAKVNNCLSYVHSNIILRIFFIYTSPAARSLLPAQKSYRPEPAAR